ncbi:aldehyde dehydrogenase (NADP(+)) [Pseudomonas daroniae]|uniref:Aldehyde dehydrogenase (NADP(+)) n=1 Tax=Phytopseudomonas daroniae TaxID=2487519 RepID=A0A4Q9QGX0_9GAMM|nr:MULTISPECIES: aldehyde dehydrogenase (NADP(+)) [Pseudomonas]TBU73774.1 aldehyde dehydrogenase (NADP(+)) [Pseudomonas daroniae]TBU79525.1 aldehyde dehydrogenase (NADP(+)) [Pseudomonas sp. FRB 228]TBU88218.1 aldehyde dehydrogenase (NADP(+)) [Pseudomonas daroniae]
MSVVSPFVPHGQHFIAGVQIATEAQFRSAPANGPAHSFSVGTPALVDQACRAAEEAFWSFGYSTREERAVFLEAIADEIEARADAITEIGTQETGLPVARLVGERGRTVMQLRLFAAHIRLGDYLERRHDSSLTDPQPLSTPTLRLMQRPIGPVAVFGASNFPLAFSVAGGDTASALAAGCPVVVKGHSAHPGTSEIVAQAVLAAITRCGMHPGVFSLVQGGRRDVGEALVQHPLIRAVGFTGSLGGGRALFDLCAARPDPIPFFGELGSVNPMFLLPAALAARGEAIGTGWAASLTMGAGQFCTNPGIAVVMRGSEGEAFAEGARAALRQTPPQVMLTDGIAAAYRVGRDRIAAETGVRSLLTSPCDLRDATPNLFCIAAKDWLGNHLLAEEVFGPLGLIITVESPAEMRDVAKSLAGQLTATIHMEEADTEAAHGLLPILERKAGRILVNGFPTGVEVCDAMVHGGPYPASTNFGATSVGTLSIRRWLRPVCYQNLPKGVLPKDLQ